MANLSLIFDLIAKDNASGAFRDVGNAAEKAGKQGDGFGSRIAGGVKLAAAGLLGAGLIEGFKSLYDAAAESAKVAARTTNVLQTTGGVAGVTAKQVGALATSISNKSGVDDEAIQSGENLLLTFCLEESAEALARGRGWVSHHDLRAGDEILAYDPEDDSARWEPVTSMHRFAVDGNLIRWKSKQIDVATTPHHRWWTVDNSGPQPYTPRFRTTEDISGKQVYVKIGGGQPEGFAGEPIYSDDLVELAGWVMTEGWFVRWRDQSRPRTARVCATCGLEPARNRAGVAVCDSCARRPIQAGRTSPRLRVTEQSSQTAGVGFCQSETANPVEVKRIRALVDRLRMAGHRISETSCVSSYNGSLVIEWHFAGDLGGVVRRMLPDKKLTIDFIESLTTDQARLLLDVLIAADGHVDRNGHEQFIQKDPGQIDVVAALAAMLGRRTTVLGRGDSIYFPETNRLQGSSVNARPEHYKGTVWCPHLRTGIFLARNRGRTFWTGNTKVRNEAGKGNDVFNQATSIITDMSVALGEDMSAASIQVGKALNDPIKGVTALQKVGVSFTAAQKDQIKTLVETGDTMGAQKVILHELTTEFGGAAEAVATPFGKLQVQLGNLAEQVGGYLIPVVDELSTLFVEDLLPALQDVGDLAGGLIGTGFKVAVDVLGTLIDVGRGAVDLFQSLPGPIQATIGVMAGLAVFKGPIAGLFDTLRAAAETAALKVLYAKDALSGLGGVGGAAKAGLGGLTSFLGGPWGVALTGATLGLSALVSWLNDSSTASVDAAGFQRDLADALKTSGGALDANVRALVAQKEADQEVGDSNMLQVAKELGVALPQMTDALLGNSDAYDKIRAQLNGIIDASLTYEHAGDATWTANAEKARLMLSALDQLAPSTQAAADKQQLLQEATTGTGTAMGEASGAAAAFEKGLQDTADAASEGRQEIDLLKGALDALTGDNVSLIQVQASLNDAIDAGTDAIKNEGGAVLDAAGALNTHTVNGRKAADVLLDIRNRGNDLIATMQEQGATTDEVTGADNNLRASFIKTANQMGITGGNADKLANQILGIPAERRTAIIADTGPARNAIAATQAQIDGLHGKTLTITVTANGTVAAILGSPNQVAGRGRVVGYATGGFTGPGMKHQVAGIVHAGEVVFSQDDVAAHGGVQRVESLRTARPGYADGGIVDPVEWREVKNVAPSVWRRLLGQGWLDRAGDHMQALYPPPGWRGFSASEGLIRLGEVPRDTWWQLGAMGWRGRGGPGGRLPVDVGDSRVIYPPSNWHRKGKSWLPPGYADGGIVVDIDDRPLATTVGAVKKGMEPVVGYASALKFAMAQAGKPYIWGAAGPGGYDCSGFMSAITNVIRGRNPYSRVGSTATFPWPGFSGGYGMFTIGSTNNAGGGIGHMAGTLLGVNVESTGDHVRYGATARGASNGLFTTRAHLAMANGGVLGEPVVGVGLRSGGSYSFAERGPETITPGLPGSGANLTGLAITGTLDLGGGLEGRIDGRITQALTTTTTRMAYNG